MARALHNIARVTDGPDAQRSHAQQGIQSTLADNAAAVEQALRVIGQLHDKGVLNVVEAMLEQGSEILTIVVEQAKRPQYAGGLKNTLGLLQLLGTLDMAMVSDVVGAFSEAQRRVDTGEAEEVGGLFQMLGVLQDPNVKRALTFMIEALRTLGKRLDGAE